MFVTTYSAEHVAWNMFPGTCSAEHAARNMLQSVYLLAHAPETCSPQRVPENMPVNMFQENVSDRRTISVQRWAARVQDLICGRRSLARSPWRQSGFECQKGDQMLAARRLSNHWVCHQLMQVAPGNSFELPSQGLATRTMHGLKLAADVALVPQRNVGLEATIGSSFGSFGKEQRVPVWWMGHAEWEG